MIFNKNLKHIKTFINILLIILFIINPNKVLSSEQEAIDKMMHDNNVKLGLGVDNRFSQGAFDMDALKCGAILYAGHVALSSTFAACMLSTVATGALVCTGSAALAGGGAMFGAHQAMEFAAKDLRQNTKIVNTINQDKPECTIAENGGNLNVKKNFHDSDIFDNKNIHDDFYYWRHSGPLGDYCYNEKFDHTLAKNNENSKDKYVKKHNIYNKGIGKIGISYRGEEPFWIAPYTCVHKYNEYFCAWREGSYICAEAVWCTGLLAGDIMPIRGFIGNPAATNSGKRSCGSDPFQEINEGEEEEDIEFIDDFADNKRCECFCCEGSNNYQECESLSSSSRSCMTYNERYRSHCVKVAPIEEKVEIAAMPGSVSAYCYSNVSSGYKEFSFTGKAMRCFENTLKNIYFGYTDKFESNIDDDGAVTPLIIEKQCLYGLVNDDGTCKKSLYNLISSDLENFISIILTFSIIFIGIRYTIGAGLSWGELLVQFTKIGAVLYFVQGNAWKDGYYDFLTKSSYELASDFYKVTLEDEVISQELTDSLQPRVVEGESEDEFSELSDDLTTLCKIVDISLLQGGVSDELKKCNFFSGYQIDGTAYRSDEKHFAILDSLDCKFSNYIGMNKNNIFPALIKSSFAIIFSKASGLFFFITAMVFLFCAIIFMLKITFMLITSIIMINFFIIISPIMIPMLLIGTTKKFFDKWLVNLIGFSLQPFLVLALISLLLILLDHFYSYIAIIYDLEVSYIQNNHLGIFMPRVNEFNDGIAISYLLQFIFLLVVIIHIFDKFSQILSHLSGAAAISNIIQAPNFEAQTKKAMKLAGGFAAKSAKFAYSRANDAYAAYKSKSGKNNETNDRSINDRVSTGENSGSNIEGGSG